MTMLFYALVLCLAISWSVDARRSDYVSHIQPYTYTSWGSWGFDEWCAAGSYAYGFRLKVEGKQGGSNIWGRGGDDTALNGIELLCRTYCGSHTNKVTSSVGPWGSWRSTKICPAHYFLKGASARSEKRQGSGDDTAANNYNFLCQHSQHASHTFPLNGDGMSWGSWSTRRDCPSGSYICGIQTQVEPKQGRGDDTALNDAKFYCCRLIRTSCVGRRR
nr:vitelline membrane outer layer like protein 1 precursor [Haliclona caerulea]